MQIEKIELEDSIEYGYYQGDEFIRHREDGPAAEYSDGYKAWYFHGKNHRDDGPAIEYTNGSKSWWIYGDRHREGGPAVECANGYKEWWLEDKYIEEKDFEEALKIYNLNKICK
jgi:hypothetical protein